MYLWRYSALGSADMSTATAAPPRALFRGLVDDAAVFPPGSAPMPEAVPAHLRHRAAWYADVVGPFLVPVTGVDAFQAAAGLATRTPIRVGVIADPTSADPLAGALDAVRRLADGGRAEPVAVEVPLPRGTHQGEAAAGLLARLGETLPSGVRAWVEVQREDGWREALRRIADSGAEVGGKLRTGGTSAQAFPSAAELAAFVHEAVAVGVPVKLTAGLHTALRGPDPTGAHHHGVLNVICAVHAATGGATAEDLVDLLEQTEADPLVTAVRAMGPGGAAAVRATFASFGCCGVTDPVGDLVGLGLLQEVPA